MNVLDLDEMLSGIVRTLDEQVGPHVAAGPARAQLYASLDLLNNLASKLEWKRELLQAEGDGIAAALQQVADVLSGTPSLPQPLATLSEEAQRLASSPDRTDDPLAWCRRCNEVLERAIVALDEANLDEQAAASARAAIEGYLVNQTIRDSMFIKPMMLKKISQG